MVKSWSPELSSRNEPAGSPSNFQFFFGQQPFRGTNEKELFKKIIRGQFSMPAITSHSTFTVTKPLRNPSAFASKKSVDDMMAERDQTFDSYRDIKHVAVVKALLEDILQTEENRRITAD